MANYWQAISYNEGVNELCIECVSGMLGWFPREPLFLPLIIMKYYARNANFSTL